jgi:hypothetical protein
MNAYKKYKNRLEQFLQTARGKRFINFAYSFGAAIVILGAMFKLLHFPFGNEMLFIGMMTEVCVFIISAFDTPVRDYPWEQVFPVLASQNPEERPDFSAETFRPAPALATPARGTQETAIHDRQPATDSGADISRELTGHTEEYNKQMESLNRTLAGLNALYEVQLKSISGQIDTIEQINRGLQRLKSTYSDTLPDGTVIGRETERMAAQLRELNDAYARMLQAMTVNRGGNSTTSQP